LGIRSVNAWIHERVYVCVRVCWEKALCVMSSTCFQSVYFPQSDSPSLSLVHTHNHTCIQTVTHTQLIIEWVAMLNGVMAGFYRYSHVYVCVFDSPTWRTCSVCVCVCVCVRVCLIHPFGVHALRQSAEERMGFHIPMVVMYDGVVTTWSCALTIDTSNPIVEIMLAFPIVLIYFTSEFKYVEPWCVCVCGVCRWRPAPNPLKTGKPKGATTAPKKSKNKVCENYKVHKDPLVGQGPLALLKAPVSIQNQTLSSKLT